MRDAASASRPHDAVSRATAILLASMPGVTIVAFSPDSRLLAGAYTDGTIRLSNPATSQPRGPVLRPGHGPAARVIGMAFSPDGTRLAGAYTDGTVRLWSVATGQLQGPPRQVGPGGQRGLDSVAFSPDGTRLAGAYTDGTIRLWNPATGQLHGPVLRPASATSATAVAFSPDGTRLAGAYTDGTIRLWNPATGQPQGSSLRIGSGRQGGVQAVAFSADGKLLAGVYDGTIQIWSRAAAKPGVLDSVNWLTMLAFAVAIAVSAAAVIKTAFETRRLKFSPPSPGSQLWIYLY
jgi:WD40 repeat protein